MARTKRNRDVDDSGSAVLNFLLRAGSKLLFGAVVVVAFLTLAQCTVKKPEAPTWSTQFVLPVVNRTYPMEELIRGVDQEGLGISDSGDVVFSITEELDTVSLNEDDFSTADLSYVISERLGTVAINAPTLAPVTATFADIGIIGSVLSGDSMIVPDTTFTISSTMPVISSFSTATLSNGQVDLTISNQLDLTLDSIVIDLVDDETNDLIARGFHLLPVPHGSDATVTLNLDGATVPAAMRLVARYHTPQDTVRTVASRSITTSFAFGDTLEAIAAVARIPELTRADSIDVTLAENDRIDSATLASGTLQVAISNATALAATVTIVAHDFVLNGAPLTVATPVAAQGTANVNLNLTGYALTPQSSVVPQSIRVIATATMPGTGLNQVAIDQTDSFRVVAQIANLSFNSVTGLFQSVSASFDGISEDLEIPTGLESVELVDAILTLEIENGIDLPGQMDIMLTGNNGKQTAFVSDVAPRGLAASVTTLVVNDSIADFLDPLPSYIEASGTVTFGDGAYLGTIRRDDFVFGRLTLHAPLEMIINPATVETDIESEEIDQEDIDVITDHFIEGRFVYQLTSHLPVGAHVNIVLGSDSTTLFTDPQLRFDSLYMTAAPVDGTGLVIDTAQTGDQQIIIDSVDIRILENPILYIGQEILLDGSDGQVVKFTANDYITITGRIEVEYLFDGEF